MGHELFEQIGELAASIKEKFEGANPLSYDRVASLYCVQAEKQLKRILASRLYPQKTYRGTDQIKIWDLKGTLVRSATGAGFDWYILPQIPEFHGKPYVFQVKRSSQDHYAGDSCHSASLPCTDSYELVPQNYLATEFPTPAFKNIMCEWPIVAIMFLVNDWGVDEYIRLSGSSEVVSFIGGDSEKRIQHRQARLASGIVTI